MTNELTIHGLSLDGIAHCEAKGLAKCFAAYADNASRETIMTIGFNPNSGYIYIALENGIEIVSMLGRDVEYLTTNYDDVGETFHDSYDDAISYETDSDSDDEEEEE